jgi:F0F1-type ATP synthase membrane subunit b/b'
LGLPGPPILSTIGFRSGQEKADDRIEAVKKEAVEKIETLKKELTPKVAEKVASAERAEKVETPTLAGEVEKMVVEEIDRTNSAVQKKLDETRQMIKRDVRGLL